MYKTGFDWEETKEIYARDLPFYLNARKPPATHACAQAPATILENKNSIYKRVRPMLGRSWRTSEVFIPVS
jgi:hypothetical protein